MLERILAEINAGIDTIAPLLNGETRQIAECQIIGLEEAKKIVEKYRENDISKNGYTKRIKLFYPHAEARIYVTDKMINDYKRCTEETKRYLESGIEPEMKCEDCSWKDCEIFGFNFCEIQQLKEKMDELIRKEGKE